MTEDITPEEKEKIRIKNRNGTIEAFVGMFLFALGIYLGVTLMFPFALLCIPACVLMAHGMVASSSRYSSELTYF